MLCTHNNNNNDSVTKTCIYPLDSMDSFCLDPVGMSQAGT